MSTLGSTTALRNADPFNGQGASLYVTSGTSVVYRKLRLRPRGPVLRKGWVVRDPKTTRVDSMAGVADDQLDFAYDLSSLAAGTYTADVRHYLDGVENLSTNALTHTFTIDGSAAEVTAILGTATWIEPEIRAGGIVRIKWAYHASPIGTQPSQFRIDFTAGPTSPSDILVTATSGQSEYAVDTSALSDASAYTVTLKAENGATVATLHSGKTFTADTTGPTTPTLVSATAR